MTLRANALRDLVYHVFEIDAYKSKMGSDENVVTISFSTKTAEAATDLMKFVEKGHDFILDSDIPSGEQTDGTYKVFVEIERNSDSIKNILSLLDDVEKISGVTTFKFRYYKNWRSLEATEDNLENFVPTSPEEYTMVANQQNLNNYKNFFRKSYIESVDMDDTGTIKITKKYADPLYFKFKNFGNKTEMLEAVAAPFNFNDFGEVIFLTKYLGDYSITKYGTELFLEHQSKILVVERIKT